MEFWTVLWKGVFIISVSAFAMMAVWVTIGGALDIRYLLRLLKEEHEKKQQPRANQGSPDEENGGAKP